MVSIKNKIEDWGKNIFEEENLFLVDVETNGVVINVFIDSLENVSIQQCARVSRALEAYLDEEKTIPENYKLEVSSPGMSNPLKVPQQFIKRVGNALKITTNEEHNLLVNLLEADEEKIKVAKARIKKSKNKAIKEKVEALPNEEPLEIKYSEIKKAIIHFNF